MAVLCPARRRTSVRFWQRHDNLSPHGPLPSAECNNTHKHLENIFIHFKRENVAASVRMATHWRMRENYAPMMMKASHWLQRADGHCQTKDDDQSVTHHWRHPPESTGSLRVHSLHFLYSSGVATRGPPVFHRLPKEVIITVTAICWRFKSSTLCSKMLNEPTTADANKNGIQGAILTT